MTSVVHANTSDDELLKLVEDEAGPRRLRNFRIEHPGSRFLLASADHVGSSQRALLIIARQGSEHSIRQLRNIALCVSTAKVNGIGSVLDRIWPNGSDSRPEWGCLVTSWHADATTLQRMLLGIDTPDRRPNLLRILRDLTDQIRGIHTAGFAHGDISPANVLVSPSGAPHLIDFEYVTHSRIVFSDEPFETVGFSHPDRHAMISGGDYLLEDLQTWDRYALGKLFLGVLSDSDPYAFPELTLYNQRALRLVACLLLDGKNSRRDETALGLDTDFFEAEKYVDLNVAIEALDRLIGTSSPESSVPELFWIPENVVEVGTPSPAPFTGRVRRLVTTTEMQELATCQQLGLVSFIWPTATHTRIEHALGTYSLACSAVLNLYADPQSPLFRVMARPHLVRTLLAAALLHDVGHYPLAHDLEEASPKAFDHEDRSIRIILDHGGSIRNMLEAPEVPLSTGQEPGWEVLAEDVASVIAGSPLNGSKLSRWICGLLHSVISGTLDIDKLDYLVRDSRTLGVAAGDGIDTKRVLASLTVVVVPNEGSKPKRQVFADKLQLRLGVRAKGIRPAELVGRIRSHMFGVVYWHHSYRAIKAMIHWIVWKAIQSTAGEITGASANQVSNRLYEDMKTNVLFSSSDTVLRDSHGMPRREGAVLSLLANVLGDDSARTIFDLLSEKRWYSAVLTVEHFNNISVTDKDRAEQEMKLWKASENLPSDPEGWAIARIRVAEGIQTRILGWFSDRTEGETRTTVMDWDDQKVQIFTASSKTQLFLLDFAEHRKATEKRARRLYFAVPERSDSRLSDSAARIGVRESFDQSRLEEEFVASNGAIRLLCHPEFSDFVARSIPRETLFEMVLRELEVATSRSK